MTKLPMEYVYERRLGTRRIMNTDHPIDVVVYRCARKWVVATICNGTAETAREYTTRADAMARCEEEFQWQNR